MSNASEVNDLFERLYSQYADDVLRVSYFYLGDRQKAEDVCQDVFLRLLTRTPEIEPGHEKAWLLKVALNRCRDLWRAAWVKRVVLGSPVRLYSRAGRHRSADGESGFNGGGFQIVSCV